MIGRCVEEGVVRTNGMHARHVMHEVPPMCVQTEFSILPFELTFCRNVSVPNPIADRLKCPQGVSELELVKSKT